MLVGNSLGGKTVSWKVLADAQCKLHSDKKPYPKVHFELINPKSLALNELFGYVDVNTGEWYTGVLARIMYEICNDTSKT